MTHETRKAAFRRRKDVRFVHRYLVGHGIDIGAGDDGLSRYLDLFHRMKTVRDWDTGDGDAMHMKDVEDDRYDFVNSSHCLEHLIDPWIALNNWLRICKPGGYILIVVPDAELYEQGHWPSRYNPDHKWRFSINSDIGVRNVSILDLLGSSLYEDKIRVLKIELLDAHYNYQMKDVDQSLFDSCEPAIEIVLQKL